jgi:glycosyltransferase involved in cell wall biosynthesis
MKISIAMCTYNGERYLQQQLDSLASQIYLPSELVVCDDHSRDSTVQIVEGFSRNSPFPVHLIQNANKLGSTANFSQSIALCKGELIALCDQDDVWKEDKLAKQIAPFSDAEIGGVFCDGDLIDADSIPMDLSLWNSLGFTPLMQKQVLARSPLSVLARQNFVTGATLIFRADLRPHFLRIPDEWVHDAWIAWKICTYSRLQLLPEHLLLYRIHSNNQVGVNLRSPVTLFRTRNSQFVIRLHQEELSRMNSLLKSIPEEATPEEAQSKGMAEKRIRFVQSRIAIVQQPLFSRAVSLLLEAKSYMQFAKGWRSMIGDFLIRDASQIS